MPSPRTSLAAIFWHILLIILVRTVSACVFTFMCNLSCVHCTFLIFVGVSDPRSERPSEILCFRILRCCCHLVVTSFSGVSGSRFPVSTVFGVTLGTNSVSYRHSGVSTNLLLVTVISRTPLFTLSTIHVWTAQEE